VTAVRSQIGEQILSSVESRKKRLDSRFLTGKRALKLVISDLPEMAFRSRDYEITRSYTTLWLAPTLLDSYFERKLQENMLKSVDLKEYDLPSSTRILLKREIFQFEADRYFDLDYVPLLDKIQEDFSTFKSLEKLPERLREDYARRYVDALLDLISACSQPVVEEIGSIVGNFFANVVEAVGKNPSTSTFRAEVEKFVVDMHKKVYEWP